MAATERLSEVRSTLQRLRRESAVAAGGAQRIVVRGVQRLADQQLDALQTQYQSVLESIRAANGDSASDIARRQADMLQHTVRRVMVNARESLAIVAATRMELVDLMKKASKKAGKAKPSRLSTLKAKAKKAVAKVKAKAKKATASAKKSVAKARKQVKASKPAARARAATKKPVAKVKAAAKKAGASVSKTATAVKKRVSEATAPVVSAMQSITPSPLSRAFLATSQGKKEAAAVAVPEPAPVAPSTPTPGSQNNPPSTPSM